MKSSKTIVGVDTAKRVFQLYWVEPETGEEMNVRLSRTKFLRHFVNRVPCLVAMEACSGTQHWARQLQSFGHEVRILPARTVSPFVRGNKNDAHDARGIWMAVQQPGLRTVAVKTEEQQGAQAAIKRYGVKAEGLPAAHVFRHSAATNLLRDSTPLEVIGTLLRHQSTQTTAIYARVDVRMLREVAQPWPVAGEEK